MDYIEHQSKLLKDIRACTQCADVLPLGPRPVLNFSPQSRVLVVGQAPGTRVHKTGIPWNDPSGDRLRDWLGVDRKTFYDPKFFAIVPMGFCYPGKGKSGDLPPRSECSQTWMQRILATLTNIELTLVIGKYAQDYHLGKRAAGGVTENVRHWRTFAPRMIPLPHPSPRNNLWLRRNPWFETDLLPHLKDYCRRALA